VRREALDELLARGPAHVERAVEDAAVDVEDVAITSAWR
jgi:hypothetical protein